MLNGFKVVTLCGSTKYATEFKNLAEELTLDGNIVLSPYIFSHVNNLYIDDETNEMLLNIQKAKIDISDCVFIINVNDYIGENTKKEIEYALIHNKEIKLLFDTPETKAEISKIKHRITNHLEEISASEKEDEDMER